MMASAGRRPNDEMKPTKLELNGALQLRCYPVTERDMTESEKQRYSRWKKP